MVNLSIATKYEHPNSHRNLNSSQHHVGSSNYSPPSPLETDTSFEWNKSDPLPHGGPLPFEPKTERVVKSVRSYGLGTPEAPMVCHSWILCILLVDYQG